MPKYAVAVGWEVGIYDSYTDCAKQVNGFPNAKFKKFQTTEEAQQFINQYSKSTCDKSKKTFLHEDVRIKSEPENINCPDTFSVGKVSPSNPAINGLNKKIMTLEDKLNKYISSTNVVIEGLKNRIQMLERKRALENDEENISETVLENSKKLKIEEDIDDHQFIKDDEGFVIVYTDGACANNGKMGAKAGIGIWFGDNHPLNVSAPVQGPPTNNNAEIQAAYIAVKQAKKAKIKKLNIHTDSKFLISCITQWIHKWKKNDWQLSTGGPVKNKDELVKLDEAIQSLGVVKWIHVSGHNGIHGNEMADRLARKGAEEYRTNLTYSTNHHMSDEDDF